ncbi:MAG: hypothetical protein LH473_04590 [Chitinophagales bacterium]|nr:hypothetical protein [Chitinophagales bacterium]
MQELINKVMAASGITEEQAKKSIETVSSYIKEKMPETFRGQIDNLVNGGSLTEGIKSQFNVVADDLRNKAEDMIKDIRGKTGEMTDKLKDMFSEKK